jgi:hypothetical protein
MRIRPIKGGLRKIVARLQRAPGTRQFVMTLSSDV